MTVMRFLFSSLFLSLLDFFMMKKRRVGPN